MIVWQCQPRRTHYVISRASTMMVYNANITYLLTMIAVHTHQRIIILYTVLYLSYVVRVFFRSTRSGAIDRADKTIIIIYRIFRLGTLFESTHCIQVYIKMHTSPRSGIYELYITVNLPMILFKVPVGAYIISYYKLIVFCITNFILTFHLYT